MEVVSIILLVLAYPFIAAWMVGAGKSRRIGDLEREVELLRKEIRAATAAQPIRSEATPHADADVRTADPNREYDWYARAPEPLAKEAAKTSWVHVGVRTPGATLAPFPPHRARPARALDVARPSPAAPAQALPASPPALPHDAGADAAANPAQPAAAGTPPRRPPPTPPRWLMACKDWLMTGNLVAKLGLVIMFIGVGFLTTYVAATVTIPIELRLAGVVLADLGLLAWGWRMRTTRREIGLPIQGTAIAILMMVVCGAFQRYDLLPAALAFALLVLLTVFTCLLAVLQNAFWLAAFGITGGFASPFLVATGSDNAAALFAYYALLNAGVFVLAVKRAWRPLNLLGFVFTFLIGSAWGVLRYTPDNFAVAESFLIMFFLMYVGIGLAYTRQQQTRLKQYVDAVLVLGTPLAAFGLQAGLVRDRPFGIALSALAAGGFYLLLATVLWRRDRARWRAVVEALFSIGVIFGTLAIPFAVDGRWTSGAWALEGAGFVWFGLRQGQRRTWLFGLLLQAGAWAGFVAAATGLDAQAAATSNLWLGFVLLAGSAFMIAAGFRKHADASLPYLARIADVGIVIAALWLLGGSWTEALLRTSGATLANWLAIGALLSAALLYLAGARMAWRVAAALALGVQLLGAAGLVLAAPYTWRLADMVEWAGAQPLVGTALIAAAAFIASRLLMRAAPGQVDRRLAPLFLLWGSLWWFGPVLDIAAGRAAPYVPAALGSMRACWVAAYALAVAVSTIVALHLAVRMRWPALRWLSAATWCMLALLTCDTLLGLYIEGRMPEPAIWLAWAVALGTSEYALARWAADGAALNGTVLHGVHLVRTGGPWLAVWPTGAILIGRWLRAGAEADAGMGAHWAISAAWSNYVPTWAMMLILVVLVRRSRARKWPTMPLPDWYRDTIVPCGTALIGLLVVVWNLFQDGAMAPLPYLPILNPLDLTTGFALLLWIGAARAVARRTDAPALLRKRLPMATGLLAFAWFNLVLLRSAAQYLGIGYWIGDLAASQFVEAMLSLAWSISALVLMRFAARRTMRRTWKAGAVLLGVVVAKLFLVDLANHGSIARVVTFLGVGALMLLVGYLAPYPKAAPGETAAAPEPNA